jgi:hypothetical protein
MRPLSVLTERDCLVTRPDGRQFRCGSLPRIRFEVDRGVDFEVIAREGSVEMPGCRIDLLNPFQNEAPRRELRGILSGTAAKPLAKADPLCSPATAGQSIPPEAGQPGEAE